MRDRAYEWWDVVELVMRVDSVTSRFSSDPKFRNYFKVTRAMFGGGGARWGNQQESTPLTTVLLTAGLQVL